MKLTKLELKKIIRSECMKEKYGSAQIEQSVCVVEKAIARLTQK